MLPLYGFPWHESGGQPEQDGRSQQAECGERSGTYFSLLHDQFVKFNEIFDRVLATGAPIAICPFSVSDGMVRPAARRAAYSPLPQADCKSFMGVPGKDKKRKMVSLSVR